MGDTFLRGGSMDDGGGGLLTAVAEVFEEGVDLGS